MRVGATYDVVVGATATMIVGASPTRRRITFHPPANTRVTIGRGPGVLIDVGPTLQQGQAPLTYDYEDYGDMVCGPFWAVAPAAGVNIGITETQHAS